MGAIIINYILVLFLFLLYFILATLEKVFTKKNKERILLITVFIFSIFAGFRVIGTDIKSYKLIFEEHPIILFNYNFLKSMFQFQIEPGFVLLISYLKNFGFDFRVFLFISAFIPMIIIYQVIKRAEKSTMFLTFLLFMMLYAVRGPLDVIRHFFAAAIYLSALYSLSQKNNLGFYIKLLISLFFHYSSIITFILRPIIGFKWSFKKFIFSFMVLFFSGFLLKNLFIELTSKMTIDSTDRILYKFQSYIDSGFDVSIFQNFLLYSMWYLPIILNIFVILFSLKDRELIYGNQFLKLLLNSQIIGSLIFVFFSTIGATLMANRIEFMLGIGSAFLLKEIIVKLKGKYRIMFLLVVMYLLIYLVIQFLYLTQLRSNIF
jgi:hypothetical protein